MVRIVGPFCMSGAAPVSFALTGWLFVLNLENRMDMGLTMRTRIGISRLLLCLAGIMGIFTFAQPASAESTFYVSSSALYTTTGASTSSPQTGTSTVDKPYKNPKKYLKEKYTQIEYVSSTSEETSLGVKLRLNFGGRVIPKKTEAFERIPAEDRKNKAVAVARAFLEDEAEMLGIADVGEIQERLVSQFTNSLGVHTRIYYHRVINGLPLNDGNDIHITVNPDYSIRQMSAAVMPVPPEFYEATKNKTITKEQAENIVKQDLLSEGNDLTMLTFSKDNAIFTNTFSPYLFYQLQIYIKKPDDPFFSMNYLLNAITGEILSKHPPVPIH